ncbi:MAG TPA: hypothetical protein VFQ16_00085, partial [Burkholderiaceae bacterium]|nr:hypothetical protein [Burkholderiaceae bacterium]
MKSFLIAASMALGVANGPLAAEPVGVLGAWAVDVTRLPMPPEARPRRVTITFSDEASGRLRTRVEVVDPAGVLRLAEGVTPLDGSATPVTS